MLKPVTSPVCSVGRAPTDDELQGIAWWNALPEQSRIAWLLAATERLIAVGEHRALWDVSAADAWVAYKESTS